MMCVAGYIFSVRKLSRAAPTQNKNRAGGMVKEIPVEKANDETLDKDVVATRGKMASLFAAKNDGMFVGMLSYSKLVLSSLKMPRVKLAQSWPLAPQPIYPASRFLRFSIRLFSTQLDTQLDTQLEDFRPPFVPRSRCSSAMALPATSASRGR